MKRCKNTAFSVVRKIIGERTNLEKKNACFCYLDIAIWLFLIYDLGITAVPSRFAGVPS